MTSNLWIYCLPGLQSSRSNPSIQATFDKAALSSSLNSHQQISAPNASALHPSLRLFSLSNPSLSTTNLSGPSRRRQPPVSPLTLSPGPEAHQGFSRQLSSTSPLNPYPSSQVNTNYDETDWKIEELLSFSAWLWIGSIPPSIVHEVSGAVSSHLYVKSERAEGWIIHNSLLIF